MADNFLDTFDTPGILKGVHNDICTSSYEGGQFHISVVKQNYFCWSVYPREYNNLSLEVDTTMYTGEGSCGAGASLIFGFKDNKNFYMLDVTRLCPAYHVTKMANGQWQTIRPWDNGLRLGPAPGPDMAFTHLKLVVQGSDFQLYSQDKLMDKISDSAYSGGRIALSAGTWGQNVHVSFDNLQINALP